METPFFSNYKVFTFELLKMGLTYFPAMSKEEFYLLKNAAFFFYSLPLYTS